MFFYVKEGKSKRKKQRKLHYKIPFNKMNLTYTERKEKWKIRKIVAKILLRKFSNM